MKSNYHTKKYPVTFNIRMSEAHHKALMARAKRLGVSAGEVIRIGSMTKADWLRSEIEKLEADKVEQEQLHDQNENCHPTDCEHRAIDSYITSIITRHKEELKVLESKI